MLVCLLGCPQHVDTTQAQFDLLQSFTEVTHCSEAVQPEARTTWAGLSCGYCSKTFKTSGGLNRHVSLVRMAAAVAVTAAVAAFESSDNSTFSLVFPDALSVVAVPLTVQLFRLRPLLSPSLLAPNPPALPHPRTAPPGRGRS